MTTTTEGKGGRGIGEGMGIMHRMLGLLARLLITFALVLWAVTQGRWDIATFMLALYVFNYCTTREWNALEHDAKRSDANRK